MPNQLHQLCHVSGWRALQEVDGYVKNLESGIPGELMHSQFPLSFGQNLRARSCLQLFPVFSGQKLFCCHHLIRKDTFSPAWFSESKLPLTDIVVSWKKMIEAKTLRNGILRKLEMWFSETSVCLGSLAFSKPTSTFGLKLLNHLKPGGNEPCSHTEADLTAGLVGKLWLWRGQQIWSWGGPTN